MSMTSRERVERFLKRKPHDRIPVHEEFWGDTVRIWREKGWLPSGAIDMAGVFDLDIREFWALNFVADFDFKNEILSENENTFVLKDGNGTILRYHKHHDSTPEHIDFTVRDQQGWEEMIKPRLSPCERRINFLGYREKRQKCREDDRFFFLTGCSVFEHMVNVCGHQYILTGMADDPNWIRGMADAYADLTIALMEILFAREGKPDGIWFNDDLGYKGTTFMSPAMYREFIQPMHKRTIDYAKSLGLPVVLHSCGMVEKLIPCFLEAGVDCLEAVEVKAGMDILKLYKQYGDMLSFMGGMNIVELCSNSRERIDRELSKILFLKENYGYALHSDHSIPPMMEMDAYRYFIGRGRELGRYDT